MEFLKQYILENWALLLILPAFIIMLCTTIFQNRKTTKRTMVLIIAVFLLSISVFTEFYLESLDKYPTFRTVLMSIRYSATPLIVSYIIVTLTKKYKLLTFAPSIALLALNIVSIFTGIVFGIDENGVFFRGPLGYFPFIFAGIYFVILIYILIDRSSKKPMDVIPIVFLSTSFLLGLVLPFVFGKDYAQIFCTTIAIVLFLYYVFLILNLTKKDPLTGLLNRQAYYQDIMNNEKEITALISLDMNGLKYTNDTFGHAKGDEALISLSNAFSKSVSTKDSLYRVGGDEFVIVSRNSSKEDSKWLIDRIKKNVSETEYTCSIGYSYRKTNEETIDEMLKESDEMMYKEKALYYKSSKKN